MDSKIKGLTVLLMLLVVVFIAGAVVLFNYDRFRGQDTQETAAAETAYIEEDGKVAGADLSAFLYDESFFDSEQQTAEAAEEAATASLGDVSLLATSVQKDIRVEVVDHEGATVAGYAFGLAIDGMGEYYDTDEDGMLYIEGVKPGDYTITLTDVGEYSCASPTLTLKVKSVVSYTTIEDISYLIRSEDEVDVAADDTEAEGVEDVDSDDTQYTALLEEDTLEDAIQLGIDVSKWNGDIDWELVKAEGVDFAIIRCGYRGSSSGWLIEDPYFWQNLQGAKEAGVKVGVYFFTQATSMVEAVEEASMVVSLLGGEELDYPVFIDIEGAGGNGRADGLNADTRTIVAQAFCKTIQNAGYQAGVYASRNWYNNNLNIEQLTDYHIWLAEYRETPLYENRYDMWQYTSSGTVAGIEGRVDLDVSYLGY